MSCEKDDMAQYSDSLAQSTDDNSMALKQQAMAAYRVATKQRTGSSDGQAQGDTLLLHALMANKGLALLRNSHLGKQGMPSAATMRGYQAFLQSLLQSGAIPDADLDQIAGSAGEHAQARVAAKVALTRLHASKVATDTDAASSPTALPSKALVDRYLAVPRSAWSQARRDGDADAEAAWLLYNEQDCSIDVAWMAQNTVASKREAARRYQELSASDIAAMPRMPTLSRQEYIDQANQPRSPDTYDPQSHWNAMVGDALREQVPHAWFGSNNTETGRRAAWGNQQIEQVLRSEGQAHTIPPAFARGTMYIPYDTPTEEVRDEVIARATNCQDPQGHMNDPWIRAGALLACDMTHHWAGGTADNVLDQQITHLIERSGNAVRKPTPSMAPAPEVADPAIWSNSTMSDVQGWLGGSGALFAAQLGGPTQALQSIVKYTHAIRDHVRAKSPALMHDTLSALSDELPLLDSHANHILVFGEDGDDDIAVYTAKSALSDIYPHRNPQAMQEWLRGQRDMQRCPMPSTAGHGPRTRRTITQDTEHDSEVARSALHELRYVQNESADLGPQVITLCRELMAGGDEDVADTLDRTGGIKDRAAYYLKQHQEAQQRRNDIAGETLSLYGNKQPEGKVFFSAPDEETFNAATSSVAWVRQMTHPSQLSPGLDIPFRRTKGRPYYDAAARTIMINDSSSRVAIHELGHFIEDRHPLLHLVIKSYLDRRSAGAKPQPLSEMTSHAYRDDEQARHSGFPTAYIGKLYDTASSEIYSSGLEQLYTDPHKLMTEDPDLFDFIDDLRRVNCDFYSDP